MKYKAIQTGWICRTWIETTENGWINEINKFETEDEAREFGYCHNRNIDGDNGELSREFEIYKDFSYIWE